jgi:hypothetical protein
MGLVVVSFRFVFLNAASPPQPFRAVSNLFASAFAAPGAARRVVLA